MDYIFELYAISLLKIHTTSCVSVFEYLVLNFDKNIRGVGTQSIYTPFFIFFYV